MRILTAVIISVLLTVAVLAIYLVPMLFQRPPPPPPLEELVPQLRIEEGGRKAVITEPLSWAEVYNLYLNGRASYECVMGFTSSDRYMLDFLYMQYNKLRVNYSDPCPVIIEKYGQMLSGPYSLLVENNCYWLKKLFYGTEKEWYVTLAIVPPLAEKYASRYKNYSIWTIIHFENKSMVIELYNIANSTEREEFLNRYNQIVNSYPKVVVIMTNGARRFWYKDYKLLEDTRTPYVIVFEVLYNTSIRSPLDDHLESYGVHLGSPLIDGVLYINGTLKAIYVYMGSITCERTGVIVPCAPTLDDLLKIE